jgi:hypothetical protein
MRAIGASARAGGRVRAGTRSKRAGEAQRSLTADWLVVGEPFDSADAQRSSCSTTCCARSASRARHRCASGVATFVAVAHGVDESRLWPTRSRLRSRASRRAASSPSAAPRRPPFSATTGADWPLARPPPREGWRAGRRHVLACVPAPPSGEKAEAWADLCLAVTQVAPPVA